MGTKQALLICATLCGFHTTHEHPRYGASATNSGSARESCYMCIHIYGFHKCNRHEWNPRQRFKRPGVNAFRYCTAEAAHWSPCASGWTAYVAPACAYISASGTFTTPRAREKAPMQRTHARHASLQQLTCPLRDGMRHATSCHWIYPWWCSCCWWRWCRGRRAARVQAAVQQPVRHAAAVRRSRFRLHVPHCAWNACPQKATKK